MNKDRTTSMPPCQKMCPKCPFRSTSIKGWLGGWSSPEQLVNYVNFEQPFPCHLTMDTDNEKLCAGALLYMRKTCKVPRDKDLARAVSEIDTQDISDVLGFDFIKYHTLKPIK